MAGCLSMARIFYTSAEPAKGARASAPKKGVGAGVGSALREVAGAVDQVAGVAGNIKNITGPSDSAACGFTCKMGRIVGVGTALTSLAALAAPAVARINDTTQDAADRKQQRDQRRSEAFQQSVERASDRLRSRWPRSKGKANTSPSADGEESMVCSDEDCLSGKHVTRKGKQYFQLRDGRAIRCHTNEEGVRSCPYKGKNYREDRE